MKLIGPSKMETGKEGTCLEEEDQRAKEGAQSTGMEVDMIKLYELIFDNIIMKPLLFIINMYIHACARTHAHTQAHMSTHTCTASRPTTIAGAMESCTGLKLSPGSAQEWPLGAATALNVRLRD